MGLECSGKMACLSSWKIDADRRKGKEGSLIYRRPLMLFLRRGYAIIEVSCIGPPIYHMQIHPTAEWIWFEGIIIFGGYGAMADVSPLGKSRAMSCKGRWSSQRGNALVKRPKKRLWVQMDEHWKGGCDLMKNYSKLIENSKDIIMELKARIFGYKDWNSASLRSYAQREGEDG